MNSRTLIPVAPRIPNYGLGNLDSTHFLFDTTIEGGTGMLVGTVVTAAPPGFSSAQFIAIKAEALFEYERTIIELRRELLHYKAMVDELLGFSKRREDYDSPHVVVPIDQETVRIVNSVVQAQIPSSATFREFEEGEL